MGGALLGGQGSGGVAQVMQVQTLLAGDGYGIGPGGVEGRPAQTFGEWSGEDRVGREGPVKVPRWTVRAAVIATGSLTVRRPA